MIDKRSLAADLTSLRDGELDAKEFESRYLPFVRESLLLQSIWPGLEHYLADDDIRARDDRYSEMQHEGLSSLIRLLLADASLDQLQRISFLRPV